MEQIDIKQQIETMIADEHYRPLSLSSAAGNPGAVHDRRNSWR